MNSPLRAYDVLGDFGGLDPAKAVALATRVTALRGQSERIVLDFENVGTLSSGFANAFFLALAEAAPLDQWKDVLDLRGLDSHQRYVLSRSLQAARHASGAAARD